MRLKSQEIEAIIKVFQEIFDKEKINNSSAILYLYGSRTEDKKKGGDIDLLLQVPESSLSNTKAFHVRMLVKLQEYLGEQKIDLKITGPIPKDEFTKFILEKAIPLKKWP